MTSKINYRSFAALALKANHITTSKMLIYHRLDRQWRLQSLDQEVTHKL